MYPALTTPFGRDGSLDLKATAAQLGELIREGIHGVIVLGTVGEGTSLLPAEKLEVLKTAIEVAGGKIPVLAGVAEFTTAEACRFARDAERARADGLMVLPAMVYKADPRESMTHFRGRRERVGVAYHAVQQSGIVQRR